MTSEHPMGGHPMVRHGRRSATAVCAVVAAVTLGLATAACGLSSGSDFDPLDQADAPFLTTPSTAPETTTATSEAPPSGTGGPSGIDVRPSTPNGSRPTTPPPSAVEVEPVDLYFATTSLADPTLTSETRMMSQPATLARVVSALVSGPQPRSGTGLETWIPEGLVVDVDERRGVAYVELDVDLMSDMLTPAQERLAIGQLVLTLGVRPGVGQVQFTQDGQPYPVSVPDRNGQTHRGPVADDEFLPLTQTDRSRARGPTPTPTS